MANDNEIPLEITADTKPAEQGFKDLANAINKQTKAIDDALSKNIQKPLEELAKKTEEANHKMEKSFEALKEAGILALEIFAGREVIHFLEEIIGEAAKADQAVRSLGVALANTGEFTDEAVHHFEEFAKGVQATTTVSEEAALGAVTLAKSFGLTNDQAEKLAKSAIDLSAATGKDLNTAIEQLGGTFSGAIGRLGKLSPALKNLTEEQLKAGVAVDILGKKFEGTAEAVTQSFSGALTQAGHALDDVFKELGRVITQNPVIIASIKLLGDVFQRIAELAAENKDSITELISKGLKALLSFVPKVVDAFTFLVAVLDVVVDTTADFIRGVLAIGQVINGVIKVVLNFVEVVENGLIGSFAGLLEGILTLANAIPGLSKGLSAIGIDLDGLQKTIGAFADQSISDALSLDTSVSDGYAKFVDETLQSVDELVDGAKGKTKDFLTTVGEGSAKAAIFAKDASDNISKIGNSAVSATAGIKNLNKEIDNTADIAKRLAELKGAFDKVKGGVDALAQEIDKQTLSANALVDAEFQRQAILLKNAAEELALQGKLSGKNQELLDQYQQLIIKKQQLAREKLSIGDLTITEFTDAFSKGVKDIQSAFDDLDTSNLGLNGDGLIEAASKAGSSFIGIVGNGLDSAVKSVGESFSKLTIGDIGRGLAEAGSFIKDALVSGAEIVSSVLTGDFIDKIFKMVQDIASLPSTLNQIFTNASASFAALAQSLPDTINLLLDSLPGLIDSIAANLTSIVGSLTAKLPEIITKVLLAFQKLAPLLAKALGDVLTIIAAKLPEIVTSLLAALKPLVATIFNQVIPALIDAMPGVIQAIAEALPGFVDIILRSLPRIIAGLAKATPLIIRALIDAIPDIVLAIADNIGPITEALIEAAIEMGPAITEGLVESLLEKGGLERIIKGLVLGLGHAAGGIGLGMARGIGTAAETIGRTMANGFKSLADGIGKDIGDGFNNTIVVPLQDFFSELGNSLTQAFDDFISSIRDVFTGGAGAVFQSIVSAFQNVFGQLSAAIQGAFNAVFGNLASSIQSGFAGGLSGITAAIQAGFQAAFGGLIAAIQTGFQSVFGDLGRSITNAFISARDELFKPINRLIDFLSSFSFSGLGGSVGGAAGGLFGAITGGLQSAGSSVGVSLPFASGGEVPSGFPNDSFGARLTSGETVLPPDLTDQLKSFLRAPNASNGNDVTSSLLSQILNALNTPQQIQTQVTIGSRELAQVMLDLSRSNQRLTA